MPLVKGILRTVNTILYVWRSDLKGQFPFNPGWNPTFGAKIAELSQWQLDFWKAVGNLIKGKGIYLPQPSPTGVQGLHAYQRRNSIVYFRAGRIMTSPIALLGSFLFGMGTRLIRTGCQWITCRNVH
jgi:hypothetical protein